MDASRQEGALTVRAVTPDLWPALVELFGRAGASNGCWCLYWRLGPAYARRSRELNREDFARIVAAGPPPGVLAFQGEQPVGWCQVTPRGELTWWCERLRRVDEPAGAWVISCFYVRPGFRRRGIAGRLLTGAMAWAQSAGAVTVDAWPVDTAVPGASHNVFTGPAALFRRAGFVVVQALDPTRPLMRYTFPRDAEGTAAAHSPADHSLTPVAGKPTGRPD
jgi:GNAT superfamily N-acetyltransferase